MRNDVQLCLAANNILLTRKWNHAILLHAIALAWKWQIASNPLKNKLGDRMMKQLSNSVIANYHDILLNLVKWLLIILYRTSVRLNSHADSIMTLQLQESIGHFIFSSFCGCNLNSVHRNFFGYFVFCTVFNLLTFCSICVLYSLCTCEKLIKAVKYCSSTSVPYEGPTEK